MRQAPLGACCLAHGSYFPGDLMHPVLRPSLSEEFLRNRGPPAPSPLPSFVLDTFVTALYKNCAFMCKHQLLPVKKITHPPPGSRRQQEKHSS